MQPEFITQSGLGFRGGGGPGPAPMWLITMSIAHGVMTKNESIDDNLV